MFMVIHWLRSNTEELVKICLQPRLTPKMPSEWSAVLSVANIFVI
jgi:hypothetical protein